MDKTVSLAEKLLREYWDNELPVDPIRIANSIGLKVYSKDKDCEEKENCLYLDISEPSWNQRWFVAHSIAYHLLFKKKQPEDPLERVLMDIECNRFARTLLIPDGMIMELFDLAVPFKYLCDTFDVPAEQINIKLKPVYEREGIVAFNNPYVRVGLYKQIKEQEVNQSPR